MYPLVMYPGPIILPARPSRSDKLYIILITISSYSHTCLGFPLWPVYARWEGRGHLLGMRICSASYDLLIEPGNLYSTNAQRRKKFETEQHKISFFLAFCSVITLNNKSASRPVTMIPSKKSHCECRQGVSLSISKMWIVKDDGQI